MELPVSQIQKQVLAWYARYGRHDLPWRNLDALGVSKPYGVLVSEFMLQQTQVDRVVPKFKAFVHMFPTVRKLAKATPAKVTVLWSGLGYNRRSVQLHRAAQEIVQHYNGVIPPEKASLESLLGIGPYTAAAILAFGYNVPAVVVDTNIERFYELLYYGYTKPSHKQLVALAEQFIPSHQSCEWHSALMDLMSQIRKTKSPKIQQAELLNLLDLAPSWKLPALTDAPLKRPKQSTFKKSKRFFRGRIMAHLRTQRDHRATVTELKHVMTGLDMPAEFSTLDLLIGLKKDGLLDYTEPLRGSTKISL